MRVIFGREWFVLLLTDMRVLWSDIRLLNDPLSDRFHEVRRRAFTVTVRLLVVLLVAVWVAALCYRGYYSALAPTKVPGLPEPVRRCLGEYESAEERGSHSVCLHEGHYYLRTFDESREIRDVQVVYHGVADVIDQNRKTAEGTACLIPSMAKIGFRDANGPGTAVLFSKANAQFWLIMQQTGQHTSNCLLR